MKMLRPDRLLASFIVMAILGVSSVAMAVPITYTFDLTSVSGNFNGAAFTGRRAVFVCTGDNSNTTGGPYGVATTSTNDLTCTVDVEGIVSGTYAGLFRVFQTSSGVTGLSINSGADRINIGVQTEDVSQPNFYTSSGSAQTLQWNTGDTLQTGEYLTFTGNSAFVFTVGDAGSALVETTDLNTGDTNCPDGGVQIDVGADNNRNGVLDTGEISSTSYVCNGAAGPAGAVGAAGSNALVEFTALPVGDPNCANGGVQVDAGGDDDADGALSAAEIDTTEYICNGADGADGVDGADGADGSNALIATTALAVGDTNCPDGGVQIDSGVDDNNDGVLDAAEIDSTDYICDGATGANGADGADGADGNVALVETTDLAAGDANCADGGIQVDAGVDDNADGVLDAAEIDSTAYVCNGAAGADGTTGADGAAGADGADGTAALVSVTELAAGDANCSNGGLAVASGVDANGDGTLDETETDSTQFVCNGSNGANGANGADGGCSSTGGSAPTGGFLLMVAMLGLAVLRRNRD